MFKTKQFIAAGSAVLGACVLGVVVPSTAHAQLGGGGKAAPIAVSTTDFKFTPDKWTAAAGKDTLVALKNAGKVDHEFVVLKKPIKKFSEYKKENALVTVGPVKAGKTGAGKFKLPAGTYQVICTITGHFDAGMKGTLTVK